MDVSVILHQSMARLANIKYDPEQECGYSNLLLFKEYLRRLTKLYVLSGSKEKFGPNFYFDLLEEKIEGLDDQVSTMMSGKFLNKIFGIGGYVLAHSFLKWEIYKNFLPFELNPELTNLYEPLIRIFERGGYISREMKIYEVCGANQGFTLKPDYSEDPYLTDFSDEYLDYIDAQHRD